MWRFWASLFLVLGSVLGLTYWTLGAVLPVRWLGRGRAALIALDLFSLALFFTGIRYHVMLPEGLRRAGMIALSALWMAQLVLVVFVAAGRLARWIFGLFGTTGGVSFDPDRRRLLFGAAAYPVAAAAAGLYGGLAERTHTVVRELEVPVEGLGGAADGFRIAQISDIHLGLFYSLDELRALLEQCAATGADALAVTGDLFDDNEMNPEAARILDGFVPRFPKGIWFCYGNHEYFRDVEATNEALRKTRIHVLRDACALVAEGPRPLYFAGVDYPRTRSIFEVEGAASMEAAMAGVPEGAATVLLAHHPDFFDDAARHGVALALAGHTHGGQIGLFGVPLVPPVFKYMRGVYHVGPTFGYVHSGNGSWFPYRLGCPPEIAVFKLCRA